MKFFRRKHRKSSGAGFSLLEVLISLGLASVVLTVILSDVSMQVSRVAELEPRYRNLLAASCALEKAVASRQAAGSRETENGIDCSITVSSVPSDPRIQQVAAQIVAERRSLGLSLKAYRLVTSTAEQSTDSASRGDQDSGSSERAASGSEP